MMERLSARGEEIARRAQARTKVRVASGLRDLLGAAAVSIEETRVLVRGKRILARWLGDPALRFLGRYR